MASTIVSEERYLEINDPNYLHKCTKCGEFKPNTEYSPNLNKRVKNSRGRAYISECKSCRRLYNKKDEVKSRRRKTSPILRKKNRISSIYSASTANARKRGVDHSITKEYIDNLFNIQKGLCYYTNQPMLRDIRYVEDNNDSVSIDRFDSAKGYTPGNIVLCRWIVNRMKNDLEFEQFLKIVSDINNNFNK